MNKRTVQQNKLYHELVGQLYKQEKIYIYDGRFMAMGYQNPFKFKPIMFSMMSFRNLLKQLDLDFPKDENGLAVSSTKLDKEQMNSHINFYEVLLSELAGA